MFITSILKQVHTALIIYITFLLYEINKTLPIQLVGLELIHTLIICLLQIKSKGFNWNQLFLSLSLVYALRSTQLNAVRFLFLLKIFYVQRSLQQFSDNLNAGSWKIFRLLKVAFDFARLTIVFYMVLGIFVVIYKYWAYLWTDPQKTLQTHQLMYFFMITSSSIGYGDVTPKNQYQMYFLIAFIPILIISFGQYFGKAVGCFDQFIAILRESSSAMGKADILNQFIWGAQQHTNLTQYINHVQSKNIAIQQENNLVGNNWISLAYKYHGAHQPLLMEILQSQDSKQYKFLVASKLKRQFFPKGWTIIEKGNIDKHIYTIEQGQVEVNGQILKAGSTFNLNGFTKLEPSQQTYKTVSFTSVWAISVQDLLQIGKTSLNLQNKINRKLKVAQGQA